MPKFDIFQAQTLTVQYQKIKPIMKNWFRSLYRTILLKYTTKVSFQNSKGLSLNFGRHKPAFSNIRLYGRLPWQLFLKKNTDFS